jgi:hypothetical protein
MFQCFRRTVKLLADCCPAFENLARLRFAGGIRVEYSGSEIIVNTTLVYGVGGTALTIRQSQAAAECVPAELRRQRLTVARSVSRLSLSILRCRMTSPRHTASTEGFRLHPLAPPTMGFKYSRLWEESPVAIIRRTHRRCDGRTWNVT